MEEILFPVGTVVTADIADDEEQCMIIGHRIINPFSMRAWDYVAIPYPMGLKRQFNLNGSFDHDEFMYFNHPDILKFSEELLGEASK